MMANDLISFSFFFYFFLSPMHPLVDDKCLLWFLTDDLERQIDA